MQNRRLGKSPIVVSDICMGTMVFGSQTDEATALRILDQCFDRGIDFYDTAEGYPVPPDPKWVGRTEEIVGKWLKTKPREAIILATKVSGPSHVWFRSPKRSGMTALDRRNIMVAVEDSLTKLGTDYIDLYQTHWPDHGTGYDETMEVLDELVRAGKVRIAGCSNETAWGLMKSISASERLGVARYQTIQNNFSLNNRRFEDELAQVCRKEGVSLIPYSPIAGGVLTLALAVTLAAWSMTTVVAASVGGSATTTEAPYRAATSEVTTAGYSLANRTSPAARSSSDISGRI